MPNRRAGKCKRILQFKNFFSVVVMAVADSKKRFMWASSGFPWNSHDSIIPQSTTFFQKMSNGNYLPPYCGKDKEVNLCPCLLCFSIFAMATEAIFWCNSFQRGALFSLPSRQSSDGGGRGFWAAQRALDSPLEEK